MRDFVIETCLVIIEAACLGVFLLSIYVFAVTIGG